MSTEHFLQALLGRVNDRLAVFCNYSMAQSDDRAMSNAFACPTHHALISKLSVLILPLILPLIVPLIVPLRVPLRVPLIVPLITPLITSVELNDSVPLP